MCGVVFPCRRQELFYAPFSFPSFRRRILLLGPFLLLLVSIRQNTTGFPAFIDAHYILEAKKILRRPLGGHSRSSWRGKRLRLFGASRTLANSMLVSAPDLRSKQYDREVHNSMSRSWSVNLKTMWLSVATTPPLGPRHAILVVPPGYRGQVSC